MKLGRWWFAFSYWASIDEALFRPESGNGAAVAAAEAGAPRGEEMHKRE
jgi:hypothetical protein